MKEVLDDKVYYDQSGGGITINGGEVTVQWEFTLELLKACREQGINTCVENLYVLRAGDFGEVLPVYRPVFGRYQKHGFSGA